MMPFWVIFLMPVVKVVTFERVKASRKPFPGCDQEVSFELSRKKMTYRWPSTADVECCGDQSLGQIGPAVQSLLHLICRELE